jgi:hypothetical protein
MFESINLVVSTIVTSWKVTLASQVTDNLALASQYFSLTSPITHVVQHEPEPRKRKEVIQFSQAVPCKGGGDGDSLEKCRDLREWRHHSRKPRQQ